MLPSKLISYKRMIKQYKIYYNSVCKNSKSKMLSLNIILSIRREDNIALYNTLVNTIIKYTRLLHKIENPDIDM